MIKKNVYMVLDCETAGNFGAPLIYDLGWTICDRKGKVLDTFSSIIADVFYDNRLMDNAYYGSKRPMYHEWLAENFISAFSFEGAIKIMNEHISKYNVTHLCAYNLEFDRRALIATNKAYGNESKVLGKTVILQDIWGMACELIACRPGYQAFAREHDAFSEKGNVKTSAEWIYRYISRKPDFIESHTAFDDSRIEAEILAHCIKQGKKYTRGILPQPWRLAQVKG